MALIERPHDYCFSKNDIRYVFALIDLERTGLYLQVKILYAIGSSTVFTELYTFEGLKPATDGKIYISIQCYIDSVLNYVMPVPGVIVSDAADQCCRFYIEHREIDDTNLDPAWVNSESAYKRTALKGGIENYKASGNNFFINYLDVEKPFLTWQPSGQFVNYDELLYLSFLNQSGAGFAIKVRVVATDSSDYFLSLNFGAQLSILNHLFVSPAALDIASVTVKQIWFYEVSITNASGSAELIKPLRYYIEHNRRSYEFCDLVYHNSLGGLDPVRISGDTETIFERDTNEAEAGLNVKDRDNTTRSHQVYLDSISLRRSFKGNIGLYKIRTRKQKESYMDLLASKSIYMLIDQRWIPVISPQTSLSLGTRKNIIDGFPAEWKLSESNEVFTPAGKTFGVGTVAQINYIRKFIVVNNSANTVTKITLHKDTPEWIEFIVNTAPGGTSTVFYNFPVHGSFLYVTLNNSPVACVATLFDNDSVAQGDDTNVSGMAVFNSIMLNYASITDIFTIQVD